MALLKSLLTAEVQAFIKEYDEDISKLAFAGSPFPSVPIQSLLEQISSRRQIKDKLPTWFSTDYIYYPPKLNLEQTSSEITAQHKARFVEGETLADITGGFGVDTNYFAEKITSVTHFEKNERSEEHTSELQSRGHLVCRLLLEKKKKKKQQKLISNT